jgi:hypothetical protein
MPEDASEPLDPTTAPVSRRWFRWPQTPRERGHFSFRASMVFHALAMIALALWIEPEDRSSSGLEVITGWQTQQEFDDPIGPATVEIISPLAVANSVETPAAVASNETPAESISIPEPDVTAAVEQLLPRATPSDVFARGTSTAHLPLLASIPRGGGLEGRGRRGELAFEQGATPESEAAVERGLNWLIAHQFRDGSWHFDHTLIDGPCNGYCRHPGTNGSSTGATAMALLAFYGAGYTHKKGPYQQELNRGLYYLGSRMLLTQNGGDLQEGTMYAQGLATIALCEAYAMSGDENLRPFAEHAIRFILYAQDKKGGGWRYSPGEPGDTTMHGWQLMALKSASLAGISVPSPAWQLAGEFLDSVQADDGAAYGYRTPQRLPTTSAVGLLCRMYMGWDRQREALVRGVLRLDKIGPSPTNMYYNYYATQVMHHYEGDPWQRWNAKMREHLIATQAKIGHETGSWHFDDQHGNVGGRLYNTAMAVMTLEVYYRYLPLYGDRAVKESF